MLLIAFTIQGLLGAFDTIYHHELTERLPWRQTAAKELKLHGVRNFIYSIIFLSLAWITWNGIFTYFFVAMFLIELLITLIDFVEEDKTRKLPATERITHTILALNYGIILALLVPILVEWSRQPSGFVKVDFGFLSWIMTLYAAGVFIWSIRDLLRGVSLAKEPSQSTVKFPALHQPNQNILIAGGTGFIGKPFSQALINQGHNVTILTRNMEKAGSLFHGKVSLVNSLDALQNNERFDIIINLAGETMGQRWTAKSKPEMLASRINMTRQLINLMGRLQTKPSLFINSSAIGIYGTDDSTIFTENTPSMYDAIGAFPREICEQWEAEAQKAKQLGVRTCLLRTGIVLESDGGALAKMLFPFEFGLGGPIGNGKQWFSWIHRDDMIRLIIHLINNTTLSGAINVTAPEPVTNKSFSKALGRAMKRPAILPLPAFQVKLLFGEMGSAILLAGQKVLPERALESGFHFNYPTIDTALERIFAK